MKVYSVPMLALLASAGCSSHSPKYAGVDPVNVEIGGRTFQVYADGSEAQAIRVNMEWGASVESVVAAAGEAIERATRCEVVEGSLRGDVSIVDADLSC
jgi:hypothetical protein